MNNKVIIAVIVVLVVVGGILLLSNQTKIKNQSTQGNQSAQGSPDQQTTSPGASQSGNAAQAEKREAITITVTKEGFSPANVTVKQKTIVTWLNKSGGLVTVNSAVHPTHLLYPPINLGEFKDGSSVQLTFDKPGVFKYHDHLDASHTGIVTVE